MAARIPVNKNLQKNGLKSVYFRMRSCLFLDEGFTVVELLVVMIVIAMLTAIAWSGFLGLRTTMYLYQSSQMARSDIVYSQRSAMLLDRVPGELWVHGVGVDVRDFDGVQGDDQTYTLFKICSDQYNYEDYNADDLESWALSSAPYNESCLAPGLAFITGKKEVPIQGGRLGTCTTNSNSAGPKYPDEVGFIAFEAVNGRLHLYRDDGVEITAANHPGMDGVKLTYHLRNRFSSVSIKFTGEIVYEGYDPAKPNPCL